MIMGDGIVDKQNRHPDFSVLISLYIKEKAEYFDACLQSVIRQTAPPSEIVIVLDGPITDELEGVLQRYKKNAPMPVREIRCSENRGLGIALSVGVPECAYDLIARMDTDDISREDRFEKQLKMFGENPDLDICGSNIAEFEKSVDNIVSYRRVPTGHDEIAEYQKSRTAINHVTAMFKKAMVLKAGNYQDAPLMEDDYLWVRMIQAGARCANIPEDLVYVRIDGGMFERRGGWKYFLKYRNARKKILKTGYIGYWSYLKTIVIQFIVAIIPNGMRRFVFLRMLRK